MSMADAIEKHTMLQDADDLLNQLVRDSTERSKAGQTGAVVILFRDDATLSLIAAALAKAKGH